MDLQPLVSKKHLSGRSRPPQKRKAIHFDPDSPVLPFWQEGYPYTNYPALYSKTGKTSNMPKVVDAQITEASPKKFPADSSKDNLIFIFDWQGSLRSKGCQSILDHELDAKKQIKR